MNHASWLSYKFTPTTSAEPSLLFGSLSLSFPITVFSIFLKFKKNIPVHSNQKMTSNTLDSD